MPLKLSYTAVQTYLRCPKEYQLKYIEKFREKYVGSALLFGKAMDEGLNSLLAGGDDYLDVFLKNMDEQDINGNIEILNTTDKVRWFKSDLDASLIQWVPDTLKIPENLKAYDVEMMVDHVLNKKTLNVDEQKLYNYFAWESLRQKGQLLLKEYKSQIIPKIKRVIDVQGYFSIENENSDSIIGYIDMVCEWEDGRIVIFDNKTSARSYKEDSVKTSPQLATYLFALGEKYKTSHCGYIVMEKSIRVKEPRVRISVIIDEIPVNFVDRVVEESDIVAEQIKTGVFEENRKSCYNKFGKCWAYEFCHFGSKKNIVQTKK